MELLQQLKSRRTWERVAYFSRYKGWEEGREARAPVKKEDMLPVFIILFFCLLSVVIGVTVLTAIKH